VEVSLVGNTYSLFLRQQPFTVNITAYQENDQNYCGAHYRQQQKQPGVSHHEQGAKKNP
jgi:hypothetical protein